MSTTTAKRTLAHALADAEAFKSLFDPSLYERWEFAGSLRRRKSEVGDVEHVIIPRFEGELNCLWHRLDELVKAGTLTKHIYGDQNAPGLLFAGGSPRWGEKYRGVDFRGFNHEIFTADLDNWGPTLAIRTGPWEFSKMLVTNLPRRGFVNEGGYVKIESTGERISVPSEEEYFKLCGVKFLPPERRF